MSKNIAMILMVLAGLLLGFIPMFTLGEQLGGIVQSMWRSAISAVCLLAIILFKYRGQLGSYFKQILELENLKGVVLFGVLAVAAVSITYLMSLEYISVALSITLVYVSAPIVGIFIDMIFSHKVPSLGMWCLVVMMILGVVLISDVFFNTFDMSAQSIIGCALAIACGGGLGVYAHLGRTLSKTLPVELMLAGVFVVSTLACLILTPLWCSFKNIEYCLFPQSSTGWWNIIALGVLCTCLPYWIIQVVLRKSHLPSYIVTMLFMLEPVVSILIAVVLFSQIVNGMQVLGILIALLSVALLAKMTK